MKKLTYKKCGEDPGKYNNYQWKKDRFTEARAAAIAAFSAALAAGSRREGHCGRRGE